MKNYIGQSFWLTALVLLLLTSLSFLPKNISFGDWQGRQMDIFADARSTELPAWSPDTTAGLLPDTLNLMRPDTLSMDSTGLSDSLIVRGPLPPVDSMFFGTTIEDYTQDQQGLSHFFAAIGILFGWHFSGIHSWKSTF